MSWVLAIGLAALAFAAMAALFRLPRATWTTIAAALVLGLAGYAWQGHPGMPGAPKDAAPLAPGEGAAMVELRRAILPETFKMPAPRMITADAMASRDRFTEAATLLRGAVRENPRNSEAWLALGNALVAAADGQITPAAQYAYGKAEALAPQSPGVPFFVGVAELQAGRLIEAHQMWTEAARRAPEGSEQRAAIAGRIERLEAIMRQLVAMESQQGQGVQQRQPAGQAPQAAPPAR